MTSRLPEEEWKFKEREVPVWSPEVRRSGGQEVLSHAVWLTGDRWPPQPPPNSDPPDLSFTCVRSILPFPRLETRLKVPSALRGFLSFVFLAGNTPNGRRRTKHWNHMSWERHREIKKTNGREEQERKTRRQERGEEQRRGGRRCQPSVLVRREMWRSIWIPAWRLEHTSMKTFLSKWWAAYKNVSLVQPAASWMIPMLSYGVLLRDRSQPRGSGGPGEAVVENTLWTISKIKIFFDWDMDPVDWRVWADICVPALLERKIVE